MQGNERCCKGSRVVPQLLLFQCITREALTSLFDIYPFKLLRRM